MRASFTGIKKRGKLLPRYQKQTITINRNERKRINSRYSEKVLSDHKGTTHITGQGTGCCAIRVQRSGLEYYLGAPGHSRTPGGCHHGGEE